MRRFSSILHTHHFYNDIKNREYNIKCKFLSECINDYLQNHCHISTSLNSFNNKYMQPQYFSYPLRAILFQQSYGKSTSGCLLTAPWESHPRSVSSPVWTKKVSLTLMHFFAVQRATLYSAAGILAIRLFSEIGNSDFSGVLAYPCSCSVHKECTCWLAIQFSFRGFPHSEFNPFIYRDKKAQNVRCFLECLQFIYKFWTESQKIRHTTVYSDMP